MATFFEAIKKMVGAIQCHDFMSDDAPVYRNAWEQVMAPLPKWLLCAWHMLHNWNAHINSITNKECRNTVKDMLHTLMKCTNMAEFEQMLHAFLSLGSKQQETNCLKRKELEELEKFIKCFAKTYATRAEQWAYCYRSSVGLTTGNHIESMHKTQECAYFASKVNQRLDKLLLVLFSFTADKLFSRAIGLVEGKVDH
ncbi:hypothetical protein HPB50_012380 [Hyalomma asiaticum]|uniref:Uncharacterized protein n=1 Tax=Hyalomma asiaticum TaxID=266040 RepID=A0ACB7SSA6_HYAAI|nr:hypothetical protein HPB50_012380 [Hyalomma asiaticum]